MATTDTQPNTYLNGLDIDAIRGMIARIEADPDMGQTRWKIRSLWAGGAQTEHHVDGFELGGQTVDRRFKIMVDEPHELAGTNRNPNPQETLLAAMNACMMVGYVAVATVMGVRLTRLEVETTGEIDLRGFLGIDETVKPGYDKLKQVVHIAGDGTPEQFAKMHEVVLRTSPNYFNMTAAIRVDSEMVVE